LGLICFQIFNLDIGGVAVCSPGLNLSCEFNWLKSAGCYIASTDCGVEHVCVANEELFGDFNFMMVGVVVRLDKVRIFCRAIIDEEVYVKFYDEL